MVQFQQHVASLVQNVLWAVMQMFAKGLRCAHSKLLPGYSVCQLLVVHMLPVVWSLVFHQAPLAQALALIHNFAPFYDMSNEFIMGSKLVDKMLPPWK